MPWPVNSPDLNPIENAWHALQQKICTMQSKNVENLYQLAEKIWEEKITTEYYRALIESMPRRIEAVIKSKGGHPKY